MTDRKLLELAAKAADVSLCFDTTDPQAEPIAFDGNKGTLWNPLTDDGDALRLAVKLGLHIEVYDDSVDVFHAPDTDYVTEPTGDDPYAATRRAIVRAAAEIGKELK